MLKTACTVHVKKGSKYGRRTLGSPEIELHIRVGGAAGEVEGVLLLRIGSLARATRRERAPGHEVIE